MVLRLWRLICAAPLWVRAIVQRDRVEDEIDEELRDYIERRVDEEVARGATPEEARRIARLALGGLEQRKEELRETRATAWLERGLQDVRQAWRALHEKPLFTLTATLTLALAIGANTAIFGFADALLFRPLPYADPDRVYTLTMQDWSTGQRFGLTPIDQLVAIDQSHEGLSKVGLSDWFEEAILVTPDGAEYIQQLTVTPNYFDILGIAPARGRTFRPDDGAAAGRIAMLSYGAWQRRFGGDEGIVGSTVSLGAVSLDIVGILPRGFLFPTVYAGSPEVIRAGEPLRPEETGTVGAIVRLEDGVTRQQAQARMDALTQAVSPGNGAYPVLVDLHEGLYLFGRPVAALLLAAAGLVLLIACANLGIMLLVRGQRGLRDLGVRAALGATRARLVSPVVVEACLIGLAGAALALLVTYGAFDLLLRQVPEAAYRNAPVGMSLRVCLYALALGVGGGLVFSVVPAWRSARLDSQSLLLGRAKSMARLGRLGGWLVGLQVALTVVLVFGAVLVTREFVSVLRQPLGFDPENVLTVLVVPDEPGSDRQRFYVRAMEAVAGRPDVAMVGATASLPMGLQAADEGLVIPGLEGTSGAIYHALPGFFEAAAIPLVRGRLITPRDIEGNAESAVVGESLARVLDPGGRALGATFQNRSGRTFRVVGVVGDVAGREMPAYVIPDRATRVMTLLVRANRRTGAVERDLRREMSALAPGQPVSTAWWSDSIASRTEFRNPRFQSLVLGGFGSLALVLTAVGIFAVVAFAVASRRREMGVRMAVGAEPRSLVRTIVRQSLTPVVMGLAAGLVATVWVGRLAQSYLLDVELRDPLTLAWTGIAVVVAALVASYLPARRASRIDPVSVLRVE